MHPLAAIHVRNLQPEIMDQPDLAAAAHRQALDGLRRINAWSGSARILWSPIQQLARELGRPIRMLDLACGGGDVAIRLAQRAQRTNLPLRILGLDVSDVAVGHASEAAAKAGVSCNFLRKNAISDELPSDCDVAACSLFLHHLSEFDAICVLRKMSQAARHLVLVNDLVRSRLGWLLAKAGTLLLSRSPVVHVDGPRSVEGAFRIDEVRELARRAGMDDVTIASRFPCRFLLSWSKR
ncbi:MAG: methyltransferase domain-containing protein [Gemmataceae bacterium]|nr:methyltransferase domain-containing protein [Gemmataceae bacterium]